MRLPGVSPETRRSRRTRESARASHPTTSIIPSIADAGYRSTTWRRNVDWAFGVMCRPRQPQASHHSHDLPTA